MTKRTDRLNSLLKQVISEVIRTKVRNPKVDTSLITVSRVEITKDLQHAKVFLSIISKNDEEKQVTFKALKTATGFISMNTAQQVVMRFFPKLSLYIDNTVDQQIHINNIIQEIHANDDKEIHDLPSDD
jgi:ribosome-binding factor A